MNSKTRSILVISLLLIGICSLMATAQTTVSRMAKEELNTRLNDPKTIVVDVRTGRDWSSSQLKIKGAVRVEPRDAILAVETYDKDSTLVFYCS